MNVKVVVRVRPLNSAEVAASSRSILEVPERTLLVFDPVERNDGVKQPRRDTAKKVNRNQTFMFDRVFDGSCPNQIVFEEATFTIIDGLMNGFNRSVFAYGATGAGKTHTMLGNAENPGISFLMVMELFRRVGLVEDKECEISVSYLEVYNETVKDLLVPSVPLQIREDNFGVKVQGLSIHKPKDAEELLRLFGFGNKNRTQHQTKSNAESSGSHAVFQINLIQKDKIRGPNECTKLGKMSLVDFAGSERATALKSLKDGANKNQSLLALENCINALADNKEGNLVPYSNSKLTRILKDSLGENCAIVTIAAVSPSSLTYEDTRNTLKYAARLMEIKLDLKPNAYSIHPENVATTSRSSTPVNETPKSSELDPDFLISLDALFDEQIEIRTGMMNCESEAKLLSLTRKFKEQCNEQVQSLTFEKLKQERSAERTLSVSKGLSIKENRCINAEAIFAEKLEANQRNISNLLEEKCCGDAFANNSLHRYIDNKRMEVEIAYSNVQTQHINKLLMLQLNHSSSNFKLAINALKLVKDQQLLLMLHGRLDDHLKGKYENLLDQLKVPKEVTWADQANFNPEPEAQEYIRNYMLLKGLQVAPWNRQSQSGLVCNLFSSTPGTGVTKPNLVSCHNLDEPGDHSYIRVDSFRSNDGEMEKKETLVMSISPVEGGSSSVRLPPVQCKPAKRNATPKTTYPMSNYFKFAMPTEAISGKRIGNFNGGLSLVLLPPVQCKPAKRNATPTTAIPMSNYFKFAMPTEAIAGQRIGNFSGLDEVKYPIKTTPKTLEMGMCPKRRRLFAPSVSKPVSPRTLMRFLQGKQKAVPTINVQSPQLTRGGASTPNLRAEVAANPISTRPSFQQRMRNRALSSGAAEAASSGLGLRSTSIAISRNPKLKRAKSTTS